MRGLNKVILMGNLGRDPEMRYTPSGKAVTQFSMAINEQWGSEENQKSTEWVNVEAWDRSAEAIAQHFSKGDGILVIGRLKTDKYQNKEGVDVYRTKVVVREWLFVGGRGNGDHIGADISDTSTEPELEEVSFGEG